LGSFLASSGYLAFEFDGPGQGKSQGSFHEMDDVGKIDNIKAALKYLNGLEVSRKASAVLVTYGKSSYLGVKALEESQAAASCVIISPEADIATIGSGHKGAPDIIKKYVRQAGLIGFDEEFLKTAGGRIDDQLKSVLVSKEDLAYFMGVKLPLKEYRSYLERKTYQAVSSQEKPVLIISGRDDDGFDARALDGLQAVMRARNIKSRVDIFGTVGPYAGEIKRIDDRWEYVPKKHVFDDIVGWIKKLSIENSPEKNS
jgi:alpha-beta hydrolase superfamily lysophospholipase